MHFGNSREYSVNIGHLKKKLCMPFGKHRLQSVSGRQNDDRKRNASEVFRKGIHSFLSLPIFTDFLWKLPEVHYTRYVKMVMVHRATVKKE